jgi:hypothetical protein
MEGIGKGIGQAILLLCLSAAIIAASIVGCVIWVLDDDSIRSHHPLTPRLELIIDSGRVDTMYVYKAERK